MNINFYRLNRTNSYLIIDITQKIDNIDAFFNSCADFIKNIDILHIKNSILNTKELIEIIKTLKLICAEFNTILILEDRCDIAFITDIDGVFLNKNSFSDIDAKEMFGDNKIIGSELQNCNADYFIVTNQQKLEQDKIYFMENMSKLSLLDNMVYLHRTYP